METIVDAFIKQHHLISKGQTVVVGVSGGPDSMALLHYLYVKREPWHIKIIACSVDHQLRGAESEADLEFVRQFCVEKGILFEGHSIDVHTYKKEHGVSTEVAGRVLRYRVFEKVMRKYQADILALGQHGDDQVETMLMRQVRGSFGAGKAGIPIQRSFATGQIIRPFLTITKDEIEDYCVKNGIEPRRDPTNSEDIYTRNRFRKHILPFLKQENPHVHLKFQEDSERIRDDDHYLYDLAETALSQLVKRKDKQWLVMSVFKFLETPIPLQRRIVHLILNYLYRQRQELPNLQSVHIENVMYWLSKARASGELHLPDGLVAERSYDDCLFHFKKNRSSKPYHVQLEIPGHTDFPMGSILAEVLHTYPKNSRGLDYFICDWEVVGKPLFVRSRLAGDRIHPLGMTGAKKLKSLFIDQKIKREDRDCWPLIVDNHDDILWVPYIRHGARASISENTSVFLKLSLESSTLRTR